MEYIKNIYSPKVGQTVASGFARSSVNEAVSKATRLRLDSGRALPGVHKADFRLRPRHALPDEELFCGKAVGDKTKASLQPWNNQFEC